MAIDLATPDPDQLPEAVRQLASWQCSAEPLQLHPGDIGWFWRLGTDRTADAVRTWHADGRLVAVGLLDGADQLRVTTAPDMRADATLADAMAGDIVHPERGVLPASAVAVEVPNGALLDARLDAAGWAVGEPWTPLERDLTEPVERTAGGHPLRIVAVDGTDAALVSAWAAVQRSAFDTSAAVDERWYAMADGTPFEDARCLLGFDGDEAAAGIIAWSAGAGRPGVIEPMGVHAAHRGRGHARAITLAAAAALRELGASSAQVCTESARVAAVATYRSAGFLPQDERFDRTREA
ncbi:Acetyltransferase (GNAT) family protein [Agrococcus baldri]|uniref:Acetyltransferase (GNAT) family protein n=1 Tax=Agrococcus baldri TaxID=153730 RepID=A0AA94HLK6_9MICO|nr:GNAT family N-acetyltransferase [Agrococcus baldri]SFS07596.1 Acetyltransferase (GNAT) family protein [Agrococcus baldri]